MKVITISMSSKCLKDPPCAFCFQTHQTIAYNAYKFEASEKIRRLVDEGAWINEPITICWEYNGYNLTDVESTWRYSFRGEGGRPNPGRSVTMTTYPDVVTPTFTGFVASKGIEAVALSFDSAKVPNLDYYVERVRYLKAVGLKVSCNWLLERIQGIYTPQEVVENVDQINILSMKPNKPLSTSELTLVRLQIEALKPHVPVAVDNCLAVQLGFDDKCHRGEDFLHVLSNGTITDCCFKEMCYLYDGDRTPPSLQKET